VASAVLIVAKSKVKCSATSAQSLNRDCADVAELVADDDLYFFDEVV